MLIISLEYMLYFLGWYIIFIRWCILVNIISEFLIDYVFAGDRLYKSGEFYGYLLVVFFCYRVSFLIRSNFVWEIMEECEVFNSF